MHFWAPNAYVDVDFGPQTQIQRWILDPRRVQRSKNRLRNSVWGEKDMKTHKVDELNLPDGKIKLYTSKRTATLTKKFIYERCLLLSDNDKDKAEYMTNFITDKTVRPVKEYYNIKRTVKKH